jgi:hypothetical protein
MFRGIRAKLKLKKYGYAIRPSKVTPMCYEIYKISDETKRSVGEILYYRGDWYFDDGKGPNAVGQLFFQTPDEAALWHVAHEFL